MTYLLLDFGFKSVFATDAAATEKGGHIKRTKELFDQHYIPNLCWFWA